jgi:hypothetical protein
MQSACAMLFVYPHLMVTYKVHSTCFKICILPFRALRMFLAVQNYVACTCRVTRVCEEYTESSQTMLGHEIHFYVPCGVTL